MLTFTVDISRRHLLTQATVSTAMTAATGSAVAFIHSILYSSERAKTSRSELLSDSAPLQASFTSDNKANKTFMPTEFEASGSSLQFSLLLPLLFPTFAFLQCLPLRELFVILVLAYVKEEINRFSI